VGLWNPGGVHIKKTSLCEIFSNKNNPIFTVLREVLGEIPGNVFQTCPYKVRRDTQKTMSQILRFWYVESM
jgi:hypothetical protein